MRRAIGEFGFWAGSACCAMAMMLTSVLAGPARASDGIVSDALIDRAGLTVDWFTHSGAGANSKLVDWQLVINENKATTFFTITAGPYRETFSEKKISPFGEPYGIDGAVEYASMRKEVLEAEFKNDGIENVEVKISQYSLPESTIYFVTSRGIVKAIDADTGEMKWSTLVGDGRFPSIGIGASVDFIAAVNGSSIYCLEAETGKVIWTRKCRYAISAPPSVSEENIYVPLVNGRLESFAIEDRGLNSSVFVSMGVGMARPLITEKTVSWPTSRGDMNVAARFGSYRGVSYQLNAGSAIVSSPTFRDETLFVSSLDGFVYAVDENRGSVNWQVSTGAAISQSPIPLGKNVFVINDHHELFKLNMDDGSNAPGWETPRSDIAKFVGAGKANLYVLDQFGNLKVISQGSGTTLSTVPFGSIDLILPNLESDRLYVADQGMIQCIREVARPVPHYHLNDEFGPVELDPDAAAVNMEGDTVKPTAKGDLEDPFKTQDANEDPFNPKKPAAENDPFNQKSMDEASDPFAGEKTGGNAGNPFAGEKADDTGNPFSGNKADDAAKPDEGGAKTDEKKPAEDNSSGVEDDPFKLD